MSMHTAIGVEEPHEAVLVSSDDGPFYAAFAARRACADFLRF